MPTTTSDTLQPLPPQVIDVFQELTPHLTEEGHTQLTMELIKALDLSGRIGNAQPVNDVISAWYRTLVLRSQPDYDDVMAEAWDEESLEREALTVEEMRAEFGT